MTHADTMPKPRRNVELLLLVLALAVSIGANALISIDEQNAFDTDFWFQSSLLAVAALAFHVVLRIRAKYADPVILPLVVALNGLGLAMIHRLDAPGEDTGNNQMRWTLIAMAVAIAVIWLLKDHRVLRRFTYISLAVSALLLILPLVPGISAGEILGRPRLDPARPHDLPARRGREDHAGYILRRVSYHPTATSSCWQAGRSVPCSSRGSRTWDP